MPHSQTYSTLPAFFAKADIDLAAFDQLCSQTTNPEDYAMARGIEQNVVIYDGDAMRKTLSDAEATARLKAELCRCLRDGPGVFAIKKAYSDTNIIDQTTAIFKNIIAEEKASGQERGDHFGSNERIWNSIQKACVNAPELFIDYYGNELLALAAQAWLGPHYQMTAQVNNVKPGNQAQAAHRDYHLGFQSTATSLQFPAHAQVMSQYLTLQGAIAHTNMPLESGPTLFLPFSQQYPPGYLAYRESEFKSYFAEHSVQLPFVKGDAVFFSPALFHGAGTNTAQHDRMANLVQISSAFGRPMETVNRHKMIEAVYPVLLDRAKQGDMSDRIIENSIAALADGYSFPTNLDSDPPIEGAAPETSQQLVHRALREQWTLAELMEAWDTYAQRRLA